MVKECGVVPAVGRDQVYDAERKVDVVSSMMLSMIKRGVHAAIPQVKLGVAHRHLGGLDLGTRRGDPDLVIRHRLLVAGAVRRNLGLPLLAVGFRLVQVFGRARVAGQ
jgi:hypothetical protein